MCLTIPVSSSPHYFWMHLVVDVPYLNSTYVSIKASNIAITKSYPSLAAKDTMSYTGLAYAKEGEQMSVTIVNVTS